MDGHNSHKANRIAVKNRLEVYFNQLEVSLAMRAAGIPEFLDAANVTSESLELFLDIDGTPLGYLNE